jgi:hypothetical protein
MAATGRPIHRTAPAIGLHNTGNPTETIDFSSLFTWSLTVFQSDLNRQTKGTISLTLSKQLA